MTEKTDMEKRRDGIVDQRIGSKSELRRITSQISAKLDDTRHYRIKIDSQDNYLDVAFGMRAIYLSGTKLGAELTPRKAEILAYALLEAAKRVENKG